MSQTNGEPGFTIQEVDSTYASSRDRFIVSLIVGYDEAEGVHSPEEALAAALRLVEDPDNGRDTHSYVHDRKTGTTHLI